MNLLEKSSNHFPDLYVAQSRKKLNSVCFWFTFAVIGLSGLISYVLVSSPKEQAQIILLVLMGYSGLSLLRMCFYVLGSLKYDQIAKSHQNIKEMDSYPFISVLVPAYNEEAVIAEVIRNYSVIDYPNFEIIIVDDGSKDETFETESGDLSIGDINGISVKISKELSKNIALNAGAARMSSDSGDETRMTVGLIGKSDSGDLVGWVNGMLFSNNPKYPNSDFAITAGAKYQLTKSTDVVVEMTYVEKEVMQYSIGTNVAVTSRITVGAEVRYNDYEDAREDEIVFGLNTRYTFGVNNYGPNEEYIFGE